MMGRTAPKAKVSVTLEPRLLARALQLGRGRSRSQVIETALAEWVRARRRQAANEEVARYYAERSVAEREEDDRWAGMGDETVRRSR